ncbi:UNVERIFIED_CONTAM: hypothetical protein GTU68_013164 [Idotea baltica]|nr:hypothetical protein [Idotea baltica]
MAEREPMEVEHSLVKTRPKLIDLRLMLHVTLQKTLWQPEWRKKF